MKRVRWFSARWPVSLRTVASKMKAHSYGGRSREGFIIERVHDDMITGRYVEKVTMHETVSDPFGVTSVFERTLYNQVEFVLTSKFPNIEFYDAPRNTQAFVSRLAEINNFALEIIPLEVDLVKWADSFQDELKARAIVDTLQVSGLEVEEGVTARLVLTGDDEVRGALRTLAKNKSYELDRIHLRLLRSGVPIAFQLSRTGTVKLDESQLEEFLPVLRSSLPQPRG